MYNRYIPDDTAYARVEEEPGPPPERKHPEPGPPRDRQPQRAAATHAASGPQPPGQSGPIGLGGFKLPSFLAGKDGLSALFSGKERGGLSGLLKTLHLEDIDTGDILLLLIILYLLVEGDDLELVIALGLVLIMGLGDKADRGSKDDQPEANT